MTTSVIASVSEPKREARKPLWIRVYTDNDRNMEPSVAAKEGA